MLHFPRLFKTHIIIIINIILFYSILVTGKGPKSNTSDKKRIEESEQIQENVMPISDHHTVDITGICYINMHFYYE